MSTFSKDMQDLLDSVKSSERTLALLSKFKDEGGIHRLHIDVEHRDEEVAAAVSQVAARHVPMETVLRLMISAAERELSEAKQELSAHGLTVEITQAGGGAA